jgi:transcriptional regulator with XRE-family HTH domain
MVMKALNLGTPNLKDVAREAGVSYNAVRAYKKGQRTPSPAVRRQLADALRRFSVNLRKAADDLERSGREP